MAPTSDDADVAEARRSIQGLSAAGEGGEGKQRSGGCLG